MKKIYLIALSAILVLGMFGCGKKDDTVSITVVSPFDAEDGNRGNFVSAYEAFEKAEGITVNDKSATSNEAWKAQVAKDFKKNNEPDVIFYFTGADANELVEGGKMISIDEIRREYPDYASNMKDSMIPVSAANGRQYAVPVNGYWEGLFVNKKVLEACGVSIPDDKYTWEQFLADCGKIKEKGYTPIACSLLEVPHYWFEFCTFNHGSILNHSTLPAAADDKTGKIWAGGLNDIKDLYTRGFFPGNTLTANDKETSQLILEDKAAFMIDGSWKVGWFQENAADINNFAVTYVPGKGERAATDIIGGLSMGYYITAKAWDNPKKREACVKFVQAMTTDEVVSSFGALSVTALKNGTKPVENADALELSALEMTKNVTGISGAAQDLLKTSARDTLFAEIKNIAAGTITPEAAITKTINAK